MQMNQPTFRQEKPPRVRCEARATAGSRVFDWHEQGSHQSNNMRAVPMFLLHDFLDRGRSSSLVQGICSTTNSCQLPGGDSFSAEKAGGRTQKLGTRHLIAQLGALRHWQHGDFLSQWCCAFESIPMMLRFWKYTIFDRVPHFSSRNWYITSRQMWRDILEMLLSHCRGFQVRHGGWGRARGLDVFTAGA